MKEGKIVTVDELSMLGFVVNQKIDKNKITKVEVKAEEKKVKSEEKVEKKKEKPEKKKEEKEEVKSEDKLSKV